MAVVDAQKEKELDEQERMLSQQGPTVPPVKGPWSIHEDEQLSVLVQQFGPKRWSLIASKLPGRIGKQARRVAVSLAIATSPRARHPEAATLPRPAPPSLPGRPDPTQPRRLR